MVNIKLFRDSNGIQCIIAPSSRNMYKCNVIKDGVVHLDQLSYGTFVDGLKETTILTKEDVDTVQNMLRQLWKVPREILEFQDLIPGTFISVNDQVHLIHRREGRNLYCYNMEGKRTFKIPSPEYVPTFPDWIDVKYLWESYE